MDNYMHSGPLARVLHQSRSNTQHWQVLYRDIRQFCVFWEQRSRYGTSASSLTVDERTLCYSYRSVSNKRRSFSTAHARAEYGFRCTSESGHRVASQTLYYSRAHYLNNVTTTCTCKTQLKNERGNNIDWGFS